MLDFLEEIEINKRTLRASLKDMAKSAEAVDLVHVSDQLSGITRKRRGNNFHYLEGTQRVKDKEELERIKKLGIPPAWINVWICAMPNGHLQATGFDVLNRKQYRYHTLWNHIRKKTKFYRLYEFGKQIPIIREIIEEHLALKGHPKEKILATVISLLEQTSIRVGNSVYEKLYGSFGLTTLKNRHVTISGTELRFTFKGKKSIKHNITLKSKKLARIIQNCKEMPGEELFEFYDNDGNIHSINSGMVNNYIKEISGGDFTAKDFRTWVGTVTALNSFIEIGGFESTAEMNRNINSVFEIVAKQLGNTVTVCKKYYVHPVFLDVYKENKMEKYAKKLQKLEAEKVSNLHPLEQLLLKILKKN